MTLSKVKYYYGYDSGICLSIRNATYRRSKQSIGIMVSIRLPSIMVSVYQYYG